MRKNREEAVYSFVVEDPQEREQLKKQWVLLLPLLSALVYDGSVEDSVTEAMALLDECMAEIEGPGVEGPGVKDATG